MKRLFIVLVFVLGIFAFVQRADVAYAQLNQCTSANINPSYKCDPGEVFDKCVKVASCLHHDNCSNTATYPVYSCTCKPAPPTETPPPPTQPPPPPPVCNGACTPNTQCPLECPICVTSGGKFSGQGTCQSAPTSTPRPTSTPKPSNTPTPTNPPGVCNETCEDSSDCALGGDGCTACVPNGNGGKTCQVPPSVTPTPKIPACNTPCENPSACLGAQDGCTYCNPVTDTCQAAPTNTPVPTSSPAPTSTPRPTSSPVPTKRPPTPTPDFDNSMCKCDGMSVTALSSGRPFTVTAKGKVVGTDTTKAVLTGFVYRLFEGNTRLTETAQIPASVTSSSPTLVNYTGKWNYTMPSSVKKGVEYRIQAVIKCKPKATAMGGVSAVMGESTSSNTFFAGISSFVKDLVYRIQSLPMRSSQIASEDTLQLQTFNPMQITESTCSFIKFKVK